MQISCRARLIGILRSPQTPVDADSRDVNTRKIDSGGWALKPVLHSRTKILRPRATDTGSLTVRRTVRSTAPVSFAPSRRGRGRRVSRSQVKFQTRRITGPAPRPRRYKRLRVGDMRKTFSNPHSKTVSAAWERLPYNRTPSGEGQPNFFCGVQSASKLRRSLPPSKLR